MTRKTMGLLFAVTVLLHLLFPASMIFKQEWTLKQGEPVLIRTQPVDPYDVLRGRYVALAFDQNQPEQTGHDLRRRQRAYAQYQLDGAGFATVTNLLAEAPKGPSLPVNVNWADETRVNYQFTFNRYFMNEKLAPEAESAYRSMSRRGRTNAWVKVRVGKGHAVIEDLVLAGKPILEYLQTQDGAE